MKWVGIEVHTLLENRSFIIVNKSIDLFLKSLKKYQFLTDVKNNFEGWVDFFKM